jgi:hypothetical protein
MIREQDVPMEAADAENNHVVENDDIQNGNEDSIPVALSLVDPRRMKLTQSEQEWALEVKTLFKSMPDLEELSDFMYAQIALVVQKDDVEEAARRALGLQGFKQEYKILDTFEEGCRCFEKAIQLNPDYFLGYTFSEKEGTYVFVHDLAKLDASTFNTPEKVEDWLRLYYYLHTMHCNDLASIRNGVIVLAEWYVQRCLVCILGSNHCYAAKL